jgi:uncharacterized membrane protein
MIVHYLIFYFMSIMFILIHLMTKYYLEIWRYLTEVGEIRQRSTAEPHKWSPVRQNGFVLISYLSFGNNQAWKS